MCRVVQVICRALHVREFLMSQSRLVCRVRDAISEDSYVRFLVSYVPSYVGVFRTYVGHFILLVVPFNLL